MDSKACISISTDSIETTIKLLGLTVVQSPAVQNTKHKTSECPSKGLNIVHESTEHSISALRAKNLTASFNIQAFASAANRSELSMLR